MKRVNIGELKDSLSHFVTIVEDGEDVEICRRNLPVAKIVRVTERHVNGTKLGCGKGSVTFSEVDLTDPFIPEADWEMHA